VITNKTGYFRCRVEVGRLASRVKSPEQTTLNRRNRGGFRHLPCSRQDVSPQQQQQQQQNGDTRSQNVLPELNKEKESRGKNGEYRHVLRFIKPIF